MPFRFRYLHLHTIAIGLLLAIGRAETCHAFFILVCREHEVEWCNIIRYSDIAIIRKDDRQALGIFT